MVAEITRVAFGPENHVEVLFDGGTKRIWRDASALRFAGKRMPAKGLAVILDRDDRPQSSNPDMPAIVVQSSRLSSVLPKKDPTAHSKGLSSDTANPAATASPVSSTQEPTGRTQKVRPSMSTSTKPTYVPMIRFRKH